MNYQAVNSPPLRLKGGAGPFADKVVGLCFSPAPQVANAGCGPDNGTSSATFTPRHEAISQAQSLIREYRALVDDRVQREIAKRLRKHLPPAITHREEATLIHDIVTALDCGGVLLAELQPDLRRLAEPHLGNEDTVRIIEPVIMLLKHDPDNAKARESAAAHAVSEVGKARQAEAFDAGRHIFDGIHIASPWVQLEQSATEDSLQRVIRRFTAERRCREAQPLEKRREIDSLLERIATIRFFGAENREGSDLLELFALEAMRMDRALLATPEMGKTLVQMMEHNLQAWSVGIKTHQGADALTEGTFEKLLVIGSILCSQGGEHSTNLDDFCCRNDKNLVKLLRKGTKSGFPGSEIATFDEIFIKKTIAPENVLQDFSCGILRYLEIECEDPAYIAFELPLFFELLPEQLYDSVIRAPQVVKAYTDWIGAAKLVCTELVELIRKSSEEERPVYEKSLLEYLHAMSVVMNWVGGVKEFDISGFFDDERGDLIGIEFLNPEGSSDPSESASTNISSLSGQEQSFDGVSVRLVPSETELPEVGSSHNDPLTVGEISARRLSQIEGFFNCIRDELRFSSDLVISPESDILKRVGEIYTKLCSEEL